MSPRALAWLLWALLAVLLVAAVVAAVWIHRLGCRARALAAQTAQVAQTAGQTPVSLLPDAPPGALRSFRVVVNAARTGLGADGLGVELHIDDDLGSGLVDYATRRLKSLMPGQRLYLLYDGAALRVTAVSPRRLGLAAAGTELHLPVEVSGTPAALTAPAPATLLAFAA